jgi:hypothetical protein
MIGVKGDAQQGLRLVSAAGDFPPACFCAASSQILFLAGARIRTAFVIHNACRAARPAMSWLGMAD